MLYYISIEKIWEFNEMSQFKNVLLLLHRENQRIQRDVSVKERSTISLLRKSENSTRCFSKRMLFYFSIEKIVNLIRCLGWRMLYYIAIEKIQKFNEMFYLENAILFLNRVNLRI